MNKELIQKRYNHEVDSILSIFNMLELNITKQEIINDYGIKNIRKSCRSTRGYDKLKTLFSLDKLINKNNFNHYD